MSGFSAPTPIVIDACALLELLLATSKREAIAQAAGDSPLIAPDLVNVELAQSLRGLVRAGKVSAARAERALTRLSEGAVARMPTAPLLREIWSLRHNLSAYDASYVALARALDRPLLTADEPLARAPRLGVTLIVV